METIAPRLAAAGYTWSLHPPGHSLVVVVKATYDIVDSELKLADEPRALSGDVHWDDDPMQSVRYDSDFAPVKPAGELWVTGTLRPPGDVPRTELNVSLSVGSLSHRFAVVGPRHWKKGLFGGVTEPEPFEAVELRWENSFGAPEMMANPVGRGVYPDPAHPKHKITLPAIENPDQLLAHSKDAPPTHGAWPIPKVWPRRLLKAGTYGERYRRERWPWYAEDLDPGYFHAAPRALRLPHRTYFQGDEELVLDALLADQPRVRARLPGLAPRVFLHGGGAFHSMGVACDTIVLDVDRAQLLAVWRGTMPGVRESLRGLDHVYVGLDPIDGFRDPAAHARDLMRLLAEREGRDPADIAMPVVHFDDALTWQMDEDDDDDDLVPELTRIDHRLPHSLRPGSEPPAAPSVEPPFEPPDPMETARAMIEEHRQAMLGAGMSAAMVDEMFPSLDPDAELPEPPPPPEPDPEELAAARAAAEELGLGGVFDPPPLDQPPLDAPPPEDPPSPSPIPLRQRVIAAAEGGESLAGENLRGADLRDLDLRGLDLRGAILSGARLESARLAAANLDGAVLDGCSLEGAVLDGASMREASLDGVRARGVSLRGVDLTDAAGEAAQLEAADLRGATLTRAELPGAMLDRACLDEADLREADLSGAHLNEASLRRARLEEVRLTHGAQLLDACFDEADAPRLRGYGGSSFKGASFVRANLCGARLSESRCGRAVFVLARLDDADLDGASLHHADLRSVSARRASLCGVSLVECRAEGGDFLDASFEAADLRFADLRHANLYDARLYRAKLEGANLEGAVTSEVAVG